MILEQKAKLNKINIKSDSDFTRVIYCMIFNFLDFAGLGDI